MTRPTAQGAFTRELHIGLVAGGWLVGLILGLDYGEIVGVVDGLPNALRISL